MVSVGRPRILVHDVSQTLKRRSSDNTDLFIELAHLSPAGNKLMASILLELLGPHLSKP